MLAALELLVAGPNADERAADYEYPLSPRTRINRDTVADGIATADFAAGLDEGHGRRYSELVYWAIVYTLTEAPGVRGVSLAVNGLAITSLGDPPVPIPAIGRRDQAPDWARPR
jgi:spore germination protein GerM